MKYKVIVLVGLIGSSIALAAFVGPLLSPKVMAIILGIVVGVAASVPTSLMIVWLAERSALNPQSAFAPAPVEAAPPDEEPRIVVMAPGRQGDYAYGYSYSHAAQPAMAAFNPAYAAYPNPTPSSRSFTTLGGETFEPELQPAGDWQFETEEF